MPSLLIKGGRVLSPEDNLDAQLDVRVEDGVITEIGANLADGAGETIDARGNIVAPGFVDIHVHFREPGGEISETLETGLASAVAGGFTAVSTMPNTKPVIDQPALVSAQIEKARKLGLARIFPVAAVSYGSNGEELTDFPALKAAGAVAFSDDGRPVKTAGLLRQALELSRDLNVPISEHCEDASLSAGGAINEGPVAEKLHLKGIPNSSEDVCAARGIVMAESTGGHIHVAHLSTAGALDMVRQAKRRGLRVTCEVTPHHFALSDEAVLTLRHERKDESSASQRGRRERDSRWDCGWHRRCDCDRPRSPRAGTQSQADRRRRALWNYWPGDISGFFVKRTCPLRFDLNVAFGFAPEHKPGANYQSAPRLASRGRDWRT